MSDLLSPTFTLDVPEVGSFVLRKRTMELEFAIQAEYSRLTRGVPTPTVTLSLFAGIVASLRVLTVRAPDGWSLDACDPLDDDTYNRLFAVGEALREKEASFRRKPGQAGAGAGQEVRADGGALVPGAV